MKLTAPPDGVTSVQRALRAAQNFDSLQIEDVEYRACALGDDHAVQVQTDFGLEGGNGFRVLEATNGDGSASLARHIVHHHVGCMVSQIEVAGDAQLRQCLFAEGGDGDCSFLQRRLTAFRSHDDLFQLSVGRGRDHDRLNRQNSREQTFRVHFEVPPI
jgi:hypothetical protein